MTPHPLRLILVALLIAGTVTWLRAETPAFLVTAHWDVPPDVWKGTSTFVFPETMPDTCIQDRGGDLGVAFSGGGTRSAAATVGELRGLKANGWLSRVRYVTAVSGGSWAAVPFTYSPTDLDTLLEKALEPAQLTKAVVDKDPPDHSLALSIVKSNLFAPGAAEAAKIVGRSKLETADVPEEARSLAEKLLGGSNDETYANVIGKVFIKPHVPGGLQKRYTWNAKTRDRIKDLSPSLSVSDFVTAADDRPFLIVGGTMIYGHPAYDYPRLIPVEMTPIYTGVRQQYGDKLGGIYVSPYAYDVAGATSSTDHTVRVKLVDERRPFTLADMIGTSGAAPLLMLFRGKPAKILTRATAFFPMFNHFTVRHDEVQPVVTHLPHGDGGFTDNLGVLPLLARQVHNIIVLVNAKEPVRENPAVESLFWPLDRQEDAGGDRSMSHVFDHKHFDELERGLQAGVAAGGAAVYCSDPGGWDVLKNEMFNVAEYKGLNICWVYNQKIDTWVKKLPPDTQALVGSKKFKNFPWFSTFEENVPSVIKLSAPQVNLLTQLATWTLTNDVSRKTIEKAIAPALDGGAQTPSACEASHSG